MLGLAYIERVKVEDALRPDSSGDRRSHQSI